jgi:hypothetical protein
MLNRLLVPLIKFRKDKDSSMDQRARWIITLNDDEVSCTRPNGLIETVRWSDLQAVVIETTDHGPFGSDLFWLLIGNSSGCVIPQEAEGSEELLKRLQGLPGFNNEAVIEAMGSTKNRRFICWQKEVITEKELAALLKNAVDGKLTVYVILKEDPYETTYGDGYYGYFEDAYFCEEEAKAYIENHTGSGYKFHLKRGIVYLEGDSIKHEIEVSPFDKVDQEQIIATLLKKIL